MVCRREIWDNLKLRNEEIRLLVCDILDTVADKLQDIVSESDSTRIQTPIQSREVQNLFQGVSSVSGMNEVLVIC